MKTSKYDQILSKEQIVVSESSSSHTKYHEHNFLELTYVLQGSATHVFGSETSILSQGDYFIVDFGVRHKYTQIGQIPFVVVNCLFLPRLIDETLRKCRRFEEIANSYLIKFDYKNLLEHPTQFIFHDTDGHIGELIQKLKSEYEQKEMGHREMMRSQLIEILIDTLRRVRRPKPETVESDMIQQILNEIQSNYMEKLSLEKFAATYCYSLAYVSKRFKEETGKTFREYLQAVRIWESCRLLANTQKKISDICGLVGYSDLKFFNQIFKRQTGMSPRQFKSLYNSKNSES